MAEERVPDLQDVLASAARFQQLVPDAILVGGSAAAHHADHRRSIDHDHVVTDLRERFDAVLDALEEDPRQTGEPVRSQITRQLGHPRPADAQTIGELSHYKGLAPQWQDWSHVVAVLRAVAAHMIDHDPAAPADLERR